MYKILTRFWAFLLLPALATAQAELVSMPEGPPVHIQVVNDTVIFTEYHRQITTYTYRSADMGRTWQLLPDSLYLSQLPYVESDGKLYANTVLGIYASADVGRTWQPNGAAYTTAFGWPYTMWGDTLLHAYGIGPVDFVRRVAPDASFDTVWATPPGASLLGLHRFADRLFARTERTIHFSDDGGHTWTASTLPALPGGSKIYSLLQAGTHLLFDTEPSGSAGKIYRSDDFGATWSEEPFFVNNGTCLYQPMRASNRAVYVRTSCSSAAGTTLGLYDPQLWRFDAETGQWTVYQPLEFNHQLLVEGDAEQLVQSGLSLFRYYPASGEWQACPADGGRPPGKPYFVWPDGAAAVLNVQGTFSRPDSTAAYTWRKGVGPFTAVAYCMDKTAQYGDTIASGCEQALFFSFDRGATWTPEISFPVGRSLEKLLSFGADGLYAHVRQDDAYFLARWSFEEMAWTDLRPVPNEYGEMIRHGQNFYQGGAFDQFYASADYGQTWLTLAGKVPSSGAAIRLRSAGHALWATVQSQPLQHFVSHNNGLSFVAPQLAGGLPPTISELVGQGDQLAMVGSFFINPAMWFSDDGGITWFGVPAFAGAQDIRMFADREWLYYTQQSRIFRRRLTELRGPGPRVQVVHDANANGLADAAEHGLQGQRIQTDASINYTNAHGETGIRVAVFDDTIRVTGLEAGLTVMPAYHAVPWNPGDSTFRFAVRAAHDSDLGVEWTADGVARPGFPARYQLTVANHGNVAQHAQLRVLRAPAGAGVTAVPPPTAVLGDTLYWQLDTLRPLDRQVVYLSLLLPAGTPLGTALVQRARVSAPLADAVAENNLDTLRQTVVGSYDPNDKQVEPADNYNPFEQAQGSELTYQIRFQNTGNYPASFVSIVDTLHPALDASTFRLLAASHACVLNWRTPNVVEVFFDNINLADSTSNEPASHGFVRYAVRPRTDLGLGEKIANTAQIYFDFNPAVVTNTVETLVAKDTVAFAYAVELCAADTFGGQSWPASGTLLEYVAGPAVDTVVTTAVSVFPVYHLAIDTLVAGGTIVLGQTIWADTVLTQNFSTAAGCDSTIALQVHVVVGTTAAEGDFTTLRVAPNPFGSYLDVEADWRQAGEVGLQLFDARGRAVAGQTLPVGGPGAGRLRLPTGELPAGLYWLECRFGRSLRRVPVVRI